MCAVTAVIVRIYSIPGVVRGRHRNWEFHFSVKYRSTPPYVSEETRAIRLSSQTRHPSTLKSFDRLPVTLQLRSVSRMSTVFRRRRWRSFYLPDTVILHVDERRN